MFIQTHHDDTYPATYQCGLFTHNTQTIIHVQVIFFSVTYMMGW